MATKHPIVPEEPAPLDEQGELQLSDDMRSLAARLTAEAHELGTLAAPAAAPITVVRAAAHPATSKTRAALLALAMLLAVSLAFAGGWSAGSRLMHATQNDATAAAAPDSADVRAPNNAADSLAPNAAATRMLDIERGTEGIGRAVYEVRSAPPQIRELLAGDGLDDERLDQASITDEEKIDLLQTALDRYRSAIVYLQQRLSESQRDQLHHEQIIESLQTEIAALRTKLDALEGRPTERPAGERQ